MRNEGASSGLFNMYVAISNENININRVIINPVINANPFVKQNILGIFFLSLAINSEIYLAAVTPIPADPTVTNKFIVDLTIPNCPYSSLLRICAHIIPDTSTKNFANTDPVKDQNAPDAILFPILLFVIFLISNFKLLIMIKIKDLVFS